MSAATLGCKVCGYSWVQSMRLLGACMRKRLGAKYAVVGCKVYGDVWVHVYGFWVHVYVSGGRVYAVVGCIVYGGVWVHVCGSWVQVSDG